MSRPHLKYQWILFDADGTLFDFDRAAAAALEQTFADFGLDFAPGYLPLYEQINREAWRAFESGRLPRERLRTERFAKLFAALELSADPAAFAPAYLRHLSGHADLLPDAEAVVQRLAAVADLMIITNGLQEVQRPRFARATISKYFVDFVISEEVGAAKPDRRIFAEAFARMNQPAPDAVLIVGDSLSSDIQGGNNARIDTCWFNPAGQPRDQDVKIDFEIACLTELLTLFGLDT
jgi:YjjG family noncanonical pyrimidine nucleotidase